MDLEKLNKLLQEGIQLYNDKKYDAAEVFFIDYIQKYPGIAEPLHLLSIIETINNNYGKALEYINKAVNCHNGKTDKIYYNKSVCHFKLNQVNEAIDNFKIVIRLNHLNLDAYESIVKLSRNPEDIQTYGKTAIKLNTKSPEVYLKVGSFRDPYHYYYDNQEVYMKFFEYAIKDKRAIRILTGTDANKWSKKEFQETLVRYSLETRQLKIMFDLMIGTPSSYTSYEAVESRRLQLIKNIAFLTKTLPKGLFSNILELVSHINHSSYSFYLSYQNRDNRDLFLKISRFMRYLCPSLNYIAPHCRKPLVKKSNKKIKIGFISPFLSKNHSVCRDRRGIIEHLPREIFDVCYFIYEQPTSVLGIKLWNACQNRVILPSQDIMKSIKMIEDKELDILVYCEIAMDPIAYYLSYLRLAPIQINTWGHSDTSGIDTIDYFMSSKYFEMTTPGKAQEHYSEKLICLDSLCTYYYNPLDFINHTVELQNRYELNLSKESNIYVCLQSSYKLFPEFDNIIKNILEKDNKALIILLEQFNLKHYWIPRMEKKLKHNMSRVMILARLDFTKYMSYINISDAILDPYPFGGCNSSLEAFSLGHPIITRPSNFINGRFTHGFYQKMGILDCVATSESEYIDLAVKCANNSSWKKKISNKIKVKSNVLFQEDDSVKTWTNALIKMYGDKISTDKTKNFNDQTYVDIYPKSSLSIANMPTIELKKEAAIKKDIEEKIIEISNDKNSVIDISDQDNSKQNDIKQNDIKQEFNIININNDNNNINVLDKDEKPFWSIIMPLYNRKEYLKSSLHSIFEQIPIVGKAELLICHDYCDNMDEIPIKTYIKEIINDHSENKQVIEENLTIKYFKHTTNLGEYKNTNFGITHSTGKWIHILHDDDWVKPSTYQTFHDAIIKGQKEQNDKTSNQLEIGIVAARFYNTNVDGDVTWESPQLTDEGMFNDVINKIIIANPFHLHALAFNREIFDDIGLFDDTQRFYADWEFYRRTIKSKFKWYYVPKNLVYYRMHPDSESNKRDKDHNNGIFEAIEASKKYIPEAMLSKSKEFHANRLMKIAEIHFQRNEEEMGKNIIRSILKYCNVNNRDMLNELLNNEFKNPKIEAQNQKVFKYLQDNKELKNKKGNDFENVLDVNIECSNDYTDIHVISQYFRVKETNPKREEKQKEIDTCLIINIKNSKIRNVHLLTEELFDFNEIFGIRNSDNNLLNLAKIKQTVIGKRMTYKDGFQYCNDNLNGKICILVNADIYFDKSINIINNLPIQNAVFALTRYDIQTDGSNKLFSHDGGFGNPCIDSQDSWIFKSPILNISNNDDCDITLGKIGCDNRIAAVLSNIGLQVFNPCKTIKSFHLDLTDTRNHNVADKISGQYLYLPHSKLTIKSAPNNLIQSTSNNNLTLFSVSDNSLIPWQTPVITEKHSYDLVKKIMDNNEYDGKYFDTDNKSTDRINMVMIPWATLIDKYSDLTSNGILPIDKFKNLFIFSELNKFTIKKGVSFTVCQHIYYHKIIPYLKKMGIDILFTPHADKNIPEILGVKILPYPLYSVNGFDMSNEVSNGVSNADLDKEIFYSFIGCYQNGYMSNIRKNIFDMDHSDNTYIKQKQNWHFEKNVYHEQIRNKKMSMMDKMEQDNDVNIYKNILAKSRYSLCPSGTGPNSIRLWESLQSGAIPIILSDSLQLPNIPTELNSSSLIKWKDVCVFMKESEINNIEKILSGIDHEREIEMRNNCLVVYKLFSNNVFISPIVLFIKDKTVNNDVDNKIVDKNDEQLIISYCIGKYPDDYGGVARFDYNLSQVFPKRKWFGPSQKNEMLTLLKNTIDKKILVITDNHLACDIPNEYSTIIVHHGCAKTHAERDPFWEKNIKDPLLKKQEEMLKYRNPENTLIISSSTFCKDEFTKHYQSDYTKFRNVTLVHSSELDPLVFKQHNNDNNPDHKPIILGNWSNYNKGKTIIQRLMDRLEDEFEFKQLYVPKFNDIDQHNLAKSREYINADIYLSLSLSEGCPYSDMDALNKNLILISTNVGFVYGNIPENVCTIFDWEKRNNIDYLETLVRDTWKNKQQYINNGKQWFDDNCNFNNWKKQMSEIVNSFDSLVK
jgi:predicted O-linked N-acetylglucosamine transferase (SPINDLY family)